MLMDMQVRDLELKHLVALQAVAEERSFGRAATKLGYTQSAVSQQIAGLEKVVGETLFERPGGPKPVELTPAGALLLQHADGILERVGAAASDLAAFQAGRVGSLSVGTFQSVSVRVLPRLLAELRLDEPDLQIKLSESDDQGVLLSGLRSGDLDLAFVVLPVEGDDIGLTPLFDDPFMVVCPAGSPLALGAGPVMAQELVGVPLIGQSQSACQKLIEDNLARAGVDPEVVFRSADNGAVQGMVRAGMGHSVMGRLAIDLDDPGVVVRPLEDRIEPRTITVATMTDRHLSPAVDTFLAAAHRSVAEHFAPAV